MNEIIVKVSLDGRKGLVEIADDPIIFKSAEINKYHLLNYFQNILNFHTERYPDVCREFAKKKGYENADWIKLSITGGVFGDSIETVQSKIGGPDAEENQQTNHV